MLCVVLTNAFSYTLIAFPISSQTKAPNNANQRSISGSNIIIAHLLHTAQHLIDDTQQTLKLPAREVSREPASLKENADARYGVRL